jgi:8-amino-7-oxononanoate synthase
VCAAATAAIDLIETEPWRRQRLLALAAEFRERLLTAGVDVAQQNTEHSGLGTQYSRACGPIVPIVLRSPDRAMQVGAQLEEQGFLVGAIRPPSVPQGTSRLRITLSCAHTSEDVAHLAHVLGRLIVVQEVASRR